MISALVSGIDSDAFSATKNLLVPFLCHAYLSPNALPD